MTRDAFDKHLRRALKEAQATYRRALAAQVRGEPDAEAWEAFAEVTAALLMASWLAGARGTIDRAKVPDEAVEGMLEDGDVVEFAALPVLTEFGSKWMKPIAGWFRRRVPISRKDWELLVKAARASAGEVGDHERQNALVDLRKRSPILDGLLRGVLSRPQEGGITTVKRITNDTFFVTAMTPEQTRQTQELVARVIEERPGKSTVGKLIRSMNLGDFVTTTQALTGTELSTARLETVLRTNTNRATTEGAAEVLRDERVQAFVPLVQYSATKDPRTRPAHRAMDGYVGTIEDFDRMGLTPPCGFNCFPAWQPVAGAFDIGYRALYRGALVHLYTRSGRAIAATSNHPILTDRGWIAAQDIQMGDKVLRCGVDAVTSPERIGHHQRHDLKAASAAEVFDALAAQAVTRTTVGTQADRHVFHGDAVAMQGEIDVVRSARVLMFDVLNAEPAQGLEQRQLVGTAASGATLGASHKLVHAAAAATRSGPGGAALPPDSLRVLLDPRPFERFGLALRTEMDAARQQARLDCAARNADRFCDLVHALAGAVATDEVIDVEVDAEWTGHVYDFRSSSGIVVADGVIVSNCRCALIPVPAAMAVDKGWTRPNGTLDYAAIKRHNGARQSVVDRGEIPDPGFVNA